MLENRQSNDDERISSLEKELEETILCGEEADRNYEEVTSRSYRMLATSCPRLCGCVFVFISLRSTCCVFTSVLRHCVSAFVLVKRSMSLSSSFSLFLL